MRSLYRLEYLLLIKELKILEGQFLRKCKWSGDSFILKFTKHNLTLQPPIRANLTFLQPPSETHMLCQKLNKELYNLKLQKIELYNNDRIIILTFGEKKLIVELFSKGNIILIDKNIITFAEKELSFSSREIKKGKEYIPPQSIDIFSNEWFEKYADKPLGAMLTMMFGKPYAKHFLTTYNLEEKANVSSYNQEMLQQLIKEYTNDLKPYKGVDDFGVKKLREDFEEQESFSKIIDEFYFNISTEDHKLKKLKKTLEQLKLELKNAEREAEKYRELGDYFYNNYNMFELLRELIKKHPEKAQELNIKIEKDKAIIPLSLIKKLSEKIK